MTLHRSSSRLRGTDRVLRAIGWGDPARPAVVLLHGMLGNAEYWNDVAPLIPDRHVIALDLLGFGRSPRPVDAEYDYADHTLAVLAAVDRLGLDQPVTVVGHSMGALIALRLAAEHPDRFDRLILIGMPVFASAAIARRAIGSTLLRRTLLYGPVSRSFCLIWCHLLNPISRRLAPLYLRNVPPVVASATVDHSWRSYSRSLVNIVEQQAVAADLRTVQCPTTIVYGDDDRDAALPESWRDSSPVRVVTLGGGHQLPLERPAEIAELVADPDKGE